MVKKGKGKGKGRASIKVSDHRQSSTSLVQMSTANFSTSPNLAASSKSLHPTSIDFEDFEKFATNFLDTNKGFCNPDLIPPPTAAHKVAPEVSMPQRDDMASTVNGTNQSQGSCAHGNEQSMCLSRSSSLNLTQIAEMFDNSANEVDSAVDPALVTVKGYRVKEEVAPLLRSILSKYGDIAKDCSLKSIKGRSMILEIVCAIYLNLKNRKPTAITSWEIEDILAEVDDVEATKVEVGWLRKRVEDISEALQEIRSYTARNEVIARKTVEAEMLARELEDLTKRTQLQQSKVAAKHAEVKESTEAFMNSKEKMNLFKQPLMVQGLL